MNFWKHLFRSTNKGPLQTANSGVAQAGAKPSPNSMGISHTNTGLDYSAFIRAARGGHTETVKELLDKGADVHAQDSEGFPVLILAAMNGHTGTDLPPFSVPIIM